MNLKLFDMLPLPNICLDISIRFEFKCRVIFRRICCLKNRETSQKEPPINLSHELNNFADKFGIVWINNSDADVVLVEIKNLEEKIFF